MMKLELPRIKPSRKELYDRAVALIQNSRESLKVLMKHGLIKPMPPEDKILGK